ERVRTKAFWIGTLLVPIFFLGYIAIQVASFKKTGGERTIAVVDLTGHLFAPLRRDLAEREAELKKESRRGQGVHWNLEQRPLTGSLEATKETLRNEVLKKKLDGYLVLDPRLIEKSQAEYYAVTVSEFIAMNLSLPAIAGAMSTGEMGVPTIPVSMIVYFILFFLFGYFLYASIYTAIGAPFNTDQEAQQLAMVPGLFMVGCWAFYPAVLN